MKTIKCNFFQINRKIIGYGCCFFALGLAGCVNDDVSDLRQYVKTVKAKPKGTIQPLPEIKVVEPFIFNPDGLRNPFRAVSTMKEETSVVNTAGSGISPDFSRRKEELEAYSLDTLKMVGTLTLNKKLWGLIKVNDGTIHRVQKGNHLGLNHGEIIRILENKIELMEIVPDIPGAWREQQASIALAE